MQTLKSNNSYKYLLGTLLLSLPLLSKAESLKIAACHADFPPNKILKDYLDLEKCIEIGSLTYGAEADASYSIGSGTTGGRPVLSGINIKKTIDMTSPTFFKHILTGTAFSGAMTFIFVSAGELGKNGKAIKRMEIVLTDALVSKIDNATTADASFIDNEQVTLVYKAISTKIYNLDDKGEVDEKSSPKFDYDVSTATFKN